MGEGIMKIYSEEIINNINKNFGKSYKPFAKFVDSGEIWDACIRVVSDEELMEKIIFCNDALQIPPVKSFMNVATEIQIELSDYDKKAIGAFWGFVFKNILNYKDQKSISVRINTIKSATYFFNDNLSVEINKIHQYKDYVDKGKIRIDATDEKYRYSLSIPFKPNGKSKSALIILKNPSKATKEISDHTINNVLKYCNQNYSEVCIMNLFPCYSTNPLNVNKFIKSDEYQQIMDENLKKLDDKLNEFDDVIIAWGGNSIGNKPAYDRAIKEVMNHIIEGGKKPFDIRLKENPIQREYPWHAQVWAVNKELKAFYWK